MMTIIELAFVAALCSYIYKQGKRMANELNTLNANIVALTASVDKAVAKLGEPKIDPAAVQAAADAVASQAARLDAASV